MESINRKQIKIGTLNVSKALMKKLALSGEREEWTARARRIIETGIYKGVCETGHLFEGENIAVQLDKQLRKIVSLDVREPKKEQKKKPASGSILSQSFSEIEMSLQKITMYGEQLSDELSRTDKEISGIYHKIETTAFNMAQGYQYAKQLQYLLRKRRLVKGESAKFHVIKEELNLMDKQMKAVRHKTTRIQGKQDGYTTGWNTSLSEIEWMFKKE
ncbi:hypothetical protein [Domibacillus indicus]|uniref:hypothetical protein n=1 Tax=Domibacillus indicus TaxID=1437523 RepID=UPI000617ED59|nr:hypothetical protein [Domibacillus indicus]